MMRLSGLRGRVVREEAAAAGAKITYGQRRDHSWRGISDLELMRQMGAAVEAARPKR